ncbi:uncharacterized protein LOC122848827, partial [Aphidius gifuensis]|uniref:uncharacterized protein LOC122848827 n=1 Tax=Aphidius gifuensis TaxID=684658 RepID=UPI001CDB65DE
MIINCDLSLQDFDVVDFYGTLTCFAWQDKRLITFTYESIDNKLVRPKKTITLPNNIKNIVNYSGRVFVICKPSGIYKLSRDYKLGLLSKTGLGLGSAYHSVLIPKDDWLHADDKLSKTSELLFPLSKINISILSLNSSTTNDKFKKLLNPKNSNTDICLIANDKKLFSLTNQGAELIYASEISILNLITIKNNIEDCGIALISDCQTIIVSHITNDNQLIFKEIIFDFNISLYSLEFIQDNQEIFIVYADNVKVNLAKLKFGLNAIDNNSIVSNLNIISLKKRNDKLIGLSNDGKLVEIIVDTMATNNTENNSNINNQNYCKLDQGMLKCAGVIMDTICERVKELNNINEKLLIHKDVLNRVNIYSHKKNICHIPTIQINKTAGNLYLCVKFNTQLPKNSKIFVNIMSQGQNIFSSKTVKGSITVLELPIKDEMIDSDLNVSFDLVTLYNEEKPWCIVKNCIQELQKSNDKTNDKKKFLNAKYDTLKKLIDDDKIDMKKIINIKNSLR